MGSPSTFQDTFGYSGTSKSTVLAHNAKRPAYPHTAYLSPGPPEPTASPPGGRGSLWQRSRGETHQVFHRAIAVWIAPEHGSQQRPHDQRRLGLPVTAANVHTYQWLQRSGTYPWLAQQKKGPITGRPISVRWGVEWLMQEDICGMMFKPFPHPPSEFSMWKEGLDRPDLDRVDFASDGENISSRFDPDRSLLLWRRPHHSAKHLQMEPCDDPLRLSHHHGGDVPAVYGLSVSAANCKDPAGAIAPAGFVLYGSIALLPALWRGGRRPGPPRRPDRRTPIWPW